MKFFINKYKTDRSSNLHDLEVSNEQNSVVTVGKYDNSGFIIEVDGLGNVIWNKSYSINGKKIVFLKCIKASKGEYVLLGQHPINHKKSNHIVCRIDKNGQLIWMKRVFTTGTRYVTEVVRLGNDYFVSGWFNKKNTSNDKIELYRLNTKGDLKQSRTLNIGSDDQLLGMIDLGKSLCLYGESNVSNGYHGFLIFTEADLIKGKTHGYLFTNAIGGTRDEIRALIYNESNPNKPASYVITGITSKGSDRQTFIADVTHVESNLAVSKSVCVNVTGGKDQVIKMLSHKGFIYLLGRRIDSEYSYVLKLDNSFQLIWVKRIDLEDLTLRNIIVKGNDEIWLLGNTGIGENMSSLLIKTDLELTTCNTVDIEKIEVKEIELKVERKDVNQAIERVRNESLEANIDAVKVDKVTLCPNTTFDQRDDLWVQSPYLYLQSAGSLGQDATEGILLRWFLLRNLGKSHLPKGNYSTSNVGFNKQNDFVRIYKAKYDVRKYRELNFRAHSPVYIENTDRKWVYVVEDQTYYLFFRDVQKYDSTLAQYDPTSNAFDFLSAYGEGILELEIRNRLAFSVDFVLQSISTAAIFDLKVETFSVQGNMNLEEEAISSRSSFDQSSPSLRIVEENIRRVRFMISQLSMLSLKFEMYSDFLNAKIETSGWEDIGEFALSTDNNKVFNRLEDTSRMTINGQWQKYNDDAFVNIQNYKDRWNAPNDGLKAGVAEYLQLSENDPFAIKTENETIDGGTDLEMSLFDLLNVVSLDYHVSRMLGLGHIDTPSGSESDQYIYLAEYITQDKLDYFQKVESKQHLYLSIPTSKQQERMPQSIKTLPVEYGLNLYTGTEQNFKLTDDNGYVPNESIRYIGIKTEVLQDNSISNGFFDPLTIFSASEHTSPVFAGVEYKKKGEADWRKPEISHDSNYKDAGVLQSYETLPIPFQDDPTKALLVHKETEEGIAEYAAYSGNIFSRASQIHNSVFTDYTQFTKPNTLLPPHNLNVQLIQEESPLLLTSSSEQVMLGNLTGDPTLVRLTFLYSHLHDINYDYGNRIEVFYRDHLPRNVIGGINSIQDDSNDQYSIISTHSITYNSNGQTIIPNIQSAFIDNFKGGVLVVNEKRYHIEDIIMTNGNGDYPKLKIKKQEERNTVDLGGGNIVTTVDYLAPDASNRDMFMIIENMSIAQSWGNLNPLNFEIEIDDAQWTTKSESYDDDGMTISQDIRGIWDTATITPRASKLGVYDIKLDNIQLNHHNQYSNATGVNSVDWYKGVIRIRTVGDTADDKERKVLDVVSIVNIDSGQQLELIVHDEAFDTGNANNNIQIGSSVEVNFYPGYKVYLHNDDPSGFNQGSIMPASGEGSKKTLIGLRTVDTNTQDSIGNDYHSNIGIPQILFAQQIIAPAKPDEPTGPKYATPPDFYGRSTYTFTTKFRAETFAAIYYRADVNAILQALYSRDTIDIIKSELPAIDKDEYYSDRFQDIFSFDYPGGTFKTFTIDGDSHHMPNPDNDENGFSVTGADEPADIIDLIKEVIFNTFIPLTEQPLIYSYINGGNYTPVPKKQTIRDKYGKLLDPADSEYDQAPMAKKLSGHEVRFTDFTLDGEMSIETAYFYMVREMGNRMALSEPSKILGPIQLINTNPPEAPVVRKVTSQLADPILGQTTAVNFEINAYPESQNIKTFKIYRSINAVDALTPRTMDMVKEFDVSSLTPVDGIIQVYDDFQFENFLPFGEAIYYKIVACREVKYVDANMDPVTDSVPSKPSKTLLTNIVDNVNPSAPQIVETIANITPSELDGLVLNWNKTAHNAKYFLFKMNSTGNWNKIHEVKSNDESDLQFAFSDPLPKVNDDNESIYHRFKVTVENSSGLLNLEENILTI